MGARGLRGEARRSPHPRRLPHLLRSRGTRWATSWEVPWAAPLSQALDAM